MDIGYLTGKPMEFADPPLLPTQLIDVIEVLARGGVFFFSLLWTASGGGDGGGGCGCG